MSPVTRSKERATTVRQTTARQATVRQTTARQTTVRQTTARQTTVRQTTARQTIARRTTARPYPNHELVELTVDHKKSCMLCHRKEISEKLYGKLYKLNDVIVHYFCILLSSRATQNGLDHEGIWGFLLKDIVSELQRAAKETCCYCNKNGATVFCRGMNCQKVFHLPCGLRNDSLHQYFGSFLSFCRHHRPTQTVDLAELRNTSVIQCAICKDNVMTLPTPSIVWAPCCKRNAWLHRNCVQELALSAGYFFKCPLCNNVDIFKPRMLFQGIYIPLRDASWETVPNAFEELLERHSTCNASTCLCPHPEKRNYKNENGSWEIILCNTCGSNGTHRLCFSKKIYIQEWCCPGCQAIADKANKSKQRQLKSSDSSGSSGSSAISEEKLLSQKRENAEKLLHNASRNSDSREQSINETIHIIDDDSSNDSVQCMTYTQRSRTTNLLDAQVPHQIMHNPFRNMNSRTQSNSIITLSSDDDSSNDSIQLIPFTQPPITTNLPVSRSPHMQLPIKSSNQSFLIVPEIIELISDDENDD